tara:strand:+ start:3979 stop:4260 length:282 start_codon:yes stop_codon:yes gene_type:complete
MNFKLYFLGFICFNQLFFIKSSAEFNSNKIIKIFCLESVKAEIIKAGQIYKESFGNEVCNCYLKNINNGIEHEKSIFVCKDNFNKKFNLNFKE